MGGTIVTANNFKGGVGKSTSCLYCARIWSGMGLRVVVIDCDQQAKISKLLGVGSAGRSLSDVLSARCTIDDIAIRLPDNIVLVPANQTLAGAERLLERMVDPDLQLAKILAPLRDHADIILIDCPPLLSRMTRNALVAADAVLAPVMANGDGLAELADLMKTVSWLRAAYQQSTPFLIGPLVLAEDGTRVSRTTRERIMREWGETALPCGIRRSTLIPELAMQGRTTLDESGRRARTVTAEWLAVAHLVYERAVECHNERTY